MHLSLNLFSSFVFLTIVLLVTGNNDSMVYFPTDDVYREYSPAFTGQNNISKPFAVQQVAVRGTSLYEKYVDDIIAKGITRLTIEINKLLMSQANSGNNVLFSPISITSALALVLLGSNGATFKEISEFWGLHVGIPDIDKKSQLVHEQFARMIRKLNQTSGFHVGQEVNADSAVFVQEGYPIRPIYRSTVEELYQSNVLNVDFEEHPQEAQQLINKWVLERTNGKIKNILSNAPPPDTRIIITSALYFKAEWEHHFFEKSTRRRPFYSDGRKSKTNLEVEMMANGGEFPYYKDPLLGCEILGLPYKGNRSSMYVIMPFESSRQKLREFESKITEADLNNLVSKTKLTGAVILFPKMKIESTIDLKETLRSLGVTSLFDPQRANLALLSPGVSSVKPVVRTSFSARTIINDNISKPLENTPVVMSRIGGTQTIDNVRQALNEQSNNNNNYQNPGLYADQVLHKVFMDITEKGTEAAAATSVSLSRDGSRLSFRVDVPFSFFIRHDETKTILFWGSVAVPNPNFKTV